MMVTFVSQCEKKALNRTRRVLDAFANRIGSRTWQTVITAEGLQAVKKLLRKTATKNTAVSCHWLRSRSRSELIWVVGKRDKFGVDGTVPVNITQEYGLLNCGENCWNSTEIIALVSGIAGLFHDFGKANRLFQNKLDPKIKSKNHEPYRHEWVSLRLFEAFVRTYSKTSDTEWLLALAQVNNEYESRVLDKLIKDNPHTRQKVFAALPPVAKLVAWLIVSHHRLPMYPKNGDLIPEYSNIDKWLNNNFDSLWNSPASFSDDWSNETREANWFFPSGTPLKSTTWQIKARQIATEALICSKLFEQEWFNQRFTAHLSRLSLMLADHHYSSLGKTTDWQDPNYACYANTDQYKQYKQQLDEHNIGVGLKASEFALTLPRLRSQLPHLSGNNNFTKNVEKKYKSQFGWQDKAFRLAKLLQNSSKTSGFFGINMASTGKGKTLANARIMYALADKNTGCRFNIALGLRTLTLQTGRALADKLQLMETDYAVLIGSKAVKMLDDLSNQEAEKQSYEEQLGSESAEDLIPEDQYIDYGGILKNEILSKWLSKGSERNPKLQQLIEAPLLISTIDHLIPATEGTRGGKQIAPMLRLLTSDLVLDEPDDFGLEDLPALCRLVNWTGMLGGKVLLSTATMPPALAITLFQSYQAGWNDYMQVNGETGVTESICCAWFDEFESRSMQTNTGRVFKAEHGKFTEKRVKHLLKISNPVCKAQILPIQPKRESYIQQIVDTIHPAICTLHEHHHQTNNNHQTLSVGLVRMANINPLVAVAKRLLSISPHENTFIHYCIYHGKFPLLLRSMIETRLDKILKRDDPEAIWSNPDIKREFNAASKKNHIFVVLASPVAEVGRDHDYDWAIAEPSSMRSLIQLAGRIQRHRKQQPTTENLLILEMNYKALIGKVPAYEKPGFETDKIVLAMHNLNNILKPDQYQIINAIPRITFSPENIEIMKHGDEKEKFLNMVDLEHIALYSCLVGTMNNNNHAKLWWEHNATWSGEIQRRQRFRNSTPEQTFCLYLNHEKNEFRWLEKSEDKKLTAYGTTTNRIKPIKKPCIAKGNRFWFDDDIKQHYMELASIFDLDLKDVSKRFAEIHLPKSNKSTESHWQYHPSLGVFKEIYEEEG